MPLFGDPVNARTSALNDHFARLELDDHDPKTDEAVRSLLAHTRRTLRQANVQPGEGQYLTVLRESERRIAALLDVNLAQVQRVRRELEVK